MSGYGPARTFALTAARAYGVESIGVNDVRLWPWNVKERVIWMVSVAEENKAM